MFTSRRQPQICRRAVPGKDDVKKVSSRNQSLEVVIRESLTWTQPARERAIFRARIMFAAVTSHQYLKTKAIERSKRAKGEWQRRLPKATRWTHLRASLVRQYTSPTLRNLQSVDGVDAFLIAREAVRRSGRTKADDCAKRASVKIQLCLVRRTMRDLMDLYVPESKAPGTTMFRTSLRALQRDNERSPSTSSLNRLLLIPTSFVTCGTNPRTQDMSDDSDSDYWGIHE